jgi:antitoxin component YwqK of YwqJK toxin-antitoxin module/peroxiredoxin
MHYRLLALAAATALVLSSCGGPRTVDESWPGGQPKRHGQVVDGLQQGEWRYWYDDGKPQAIGGWKDDKQFGHWTWWWPDGRVQAEGDYLEGGRRTSHWRQYHADGQLASEGDYDRDRQDGLWRYWYDDGKPYAEGFFDFGVKSGLWRTWTPAGEVKAQGAYFLGLKVGPWLDADGRHAFGTPKGFSELATPGGADPPSMTWAMARGDHVDAARISAFPLHGIDGLAIRDGANGEGLRFSLNLGGRGLAASWYPDGALAGAGRVLDGVRHGTWRYWRTDGALAAQVEYDRGHRIGARSADGAPAGQDELAVVERIEADEAIAGESRHDQPRPAAPAPPADSGPDEDADAAKAGAAEQPTQKPSEKTADRHGEDEVTPFGDSPKPAAPALPPPVETPAPVIVAARPEQLELALPDSAAPALSPMQVLPSFWTAGEETRAAKWIQHYDTGSVAAPADDPYGIDTTVKSERTDLVGKPLPQTRFLGADGGVVDLTRFKKPVVVVLLRGFAGQVCIYCASQTAALAKRIDDFHKAGAEVVVLYPGPAESAPAFIQAVKNLSKEKPPMPVALDVSLLLVRALDVEDNLARPTSLVLDRSGAVRYAYVGKSITDRPSAEDLLREVRKLVE